MNQPDPAVDAPWAGDWDAVAAEQRRAWLRASADLRLRWLEDALTFALDCGALARDRRRRADAARAWADD
jgi:hypothetical protein